DTAIALNNAFLASGASTADASRGMQQYVQMLSKGTVDMQSWRSIQETMPIAMDKVAKSFKDQGVNSVNELYDALQDGTITFDDFNNRLIKLNDGVGGFAELAKKNSAGIRTSFSNIKTAVVKGLAN
ncbi:tape measure protein, partial [Enterobacter bugandensis]|uniref:tape measure protein n=2 Tax=Bacteria TaxID=2 RepID=UPI0021CFF5A2